MTFTCWISRGCIGVLLCLSLSIQTFGQFENIPITPFALGGSTVAASLGSESVLQNPAGLLSIEDYHVELAYADSYSAVQSGWLSIGKRIFSNTAINFALPFAMIQQDNTVENGIGQAEVVGGFQDMQAAAILTVASELRPGITLGVNGKYDMHSIDSEQTSGFGLDAGAQYYNDFAQLGVALKNIGGKTKTWSTGRSESIPMQIGLGTQIFLPFGLTALGSVDMTESEKVFGVGLMGQLSQYLTFSGGVADAGGSNNWRVGMALDLSGFVLRYAVSVHEELGVAHRFGLCLTKF